MLTWIEIKPSELIKVLSPGYFYKQFGFDNFFSKIEKPQA